MAPSNNSRNLERTSGAQQEQIEPLLVRELRGSEDGVTIRFGTSRGEPCSAKNTTTSTDILISEPITFTGRTRRYRHRR